MRSLLVSLALVAVAGCTSGAQPAGDDASGSPAAVDEAQVRDDLAALFAGDHPRPEDLQEGRCFADELLSSTEPAALREGGLLDASYHVVDPMPRLIVPLAEQVADAQLACTDFVEDSTQAQLAARNGDLDEAAYAACLRRALPQADQRAALVATLSGNWEDPALEGLSDAQATCAALDGGG